MTKQMVWREVKRFNRPVFANELIKDLTDILKEYPEAEVDVGEAYDTPYISITANREETDEEYRVRLIWEEKLNEWERQKYEKLKKKFG